MGNSSYFCHFKIKKDVLSILGVHTCKVDSKGRLMFPAKLRKELEAVLHEGLVLNRDIFEKCLVLYPKDEWNRVVKELKKLSRYKKKHQKFMRSFLMNATKVELDGAGRFLIPGLLLDIAEIDLKKKNNEVIVSGMDSKIEIWSAEKYQELMSDDNELSDLAEDIGKDIEGFDGMIGMN